MIVGEDVNDVTITCTAVTVAVGLDATFGAGGKVATVLGKGQGEAIAIQPDGSIVVAGRALGESSFDFAVLRYLANGSLDTSFGSGGVATVDLAAGSDDEAFGVALQADGKIVVVGKTRVGGGTDDFGVARWHPDGTLDDTFGTAGVTTTDIAGGHDGAQGVAIQADGAIVAAGNAGNGPDNDFGVVRYLPDGTLDAGFGSGGKVTTTIGGMTDLAQAIALTADGAIVVVGRVAPDGGSASDFGLVRYLADGTPDPAFGDGGIVRTDFGSMLGRRGKCSRNRRDHDRRRRLLVRRRDAIGLRPCEIRPGRRARLDLRKRWPGHDRLRHGRGLRPRGGCRARRGDRRRRSGNKRHDPGLCHRALFSDRRSGHDTRG